METLERIRNWKLLVGEQFDREFYMDLLSFVPNEYFSKATSYYFACGHDAVRRKRYKTWVCTDLRDIKGVFKWDCLLGHPFNNEQLDIVKSKLALGMFTYNQAKFIFRETARVLKIGGVFEITYRDYDLLQERRYELCHRMFNRYINGNGLYFGSQRKSIWYEKGVIDLAKEYNLHRTMRKERGMNVTLFFERVTGTLKKFAPEPKVTFDSKGRMINDGGDFPGA